ncbi:16S rRNA (adenine(1518)-N(6)/adenine(1519)-N(6))-dimethyltransferase RsmA [Arcanobacterium hippocoleae]|uniref:Ribosomal RNA small subunit methyltransferase A n=1 Tax=Arcanobacterium hippocoleae TaxID=149017 RepID=A0ABU1T3F8_9ACTO|nr:16S rRNA (adenine(1518)-N(6)/adenine(1519)-N(6))-dimethyltransferase RsmA [Arcanobacterium hippocoleae]MDR6939844.1 16S rRNA (adenine1518-N6/adenine1519-N6)-dimethyltransferase [Arcanobacterium hippocoleae]
MMKRIMIGTDGNGLTENTGINRNRDGKQNSAGNEAAERRAHEVATAANSQSISGTLLGPVQIRELAAKLGVHPTKTLGQNFVHDAASVRRIVRDAGVRAGDLVLEIGPGLGSLTLALLETGALVSAVEIDPLLAGQIAATVKNNMPAAANNFAVRLLDALEVSGEESLAVPAACTSEKYHPGKLVANLPYNVAVPILLTLLEVLPSIESFTVMVQAEVADRLAAEPGSRTYGVPSVKANWYGRLWRGAKISRNVFWPVPNVDSALVHFVRGAHPEGVAREAVFAVIDAAFAQRRKTLRAALSSWAGSGVRAEEILVAAGIDPKRRGETLTIDEFVQIAKCS